MSIVVCILLILLVGIIYELYFKKNMVYNLIKILSIYLNKLNYVIVFISTKDSFKFYNDKALV